MKESNTILSKLQKRYVTIRLTEIALLSLGAAILVWSISGILETGIVLKASIALLVMLMVFCFRYYQLKLQRVDQKAITRFLNITYKELDSSTDLLLTNENELPSLAKIQRFKTQQDLEVLIPTIQFPNQIKYTFLFICFAVATFFVVQISGFTLPENVKAKNESLKVQSREIVKNVPPEISEVKVIVTPPAYTKLKSYSSNDLNVKLPEASEVLWSIQFSGSVSVAGIVNSSQDTLFFTRKDQAWFLKETFFKNDFYQIVWKDSNVHASDYYTINVTKDQQPIIKLTSLNQFTEIAYETTQPINVNPVITDDFGIKDAYIIATVSKGSGESVKFREEKILFTSPTVKTGKQLNCIRSINIHTMGMEPGDELYFYVEAWDNKTPVPNRTRTETYFISLRDTAKDVMMADGGLGVDLMPEYFRSQRQIIIDTEKLIREKKITSKKDFSFKSNELGYDQKTLRLRYGQFLGEEFETGIIPVDNHTEEELDPDQEEKPEDIIKEFGHQHDTQNEHNLVADKKHDHKEETNDPDKKEDPFAEFVHQHDNEESATFFIQSLKAKLKAALGQMWDAELYLRLYELEKSLPYQYKALKLLKEISNDSRIYVHRTGFDPPPIKEEKRLSADLNEIFNTSRVYNREDIKRFTKIQKALNVTEYLLAKSNPRLTSNERDILILSGSELAQAALEHPGLLDGLSALKSITENKNGKPSKNELQTLRNAYWTVLPYEPAMATKNTNALHALDEQVVKQLEQKP